MERPDYKALYFDGAIEPSEDGSHYEVSLACDDPKFFEEGKIAHPEEGLAWLATRILKLMKRKFRPDEEI